MGGRPPLYWKGWKIMLRRILRNKIAETVEEIIEQLDIEEILENAAEKALEEYDIEGDVINCIEEVAVTEAIKMIHNDYNNWIEDAIEDEFNIEEY